ncbi:hypothetical protein VNO80_17410 [Phaseolus coccineus]|uniref:RNA polymerase sigma-70 domain-containing protein n=1 Tax=Phaseolus coccineus TaxID=3886 RepID=A0AAN9QYJ7_PHACN
MLLLIRTRLSSMSQLLPLPRRTTLSPIPKLSSSRNKSLLTNEEAVIAPAASEALALAKAAVKVAKDAALLVKKKPQAEAEYRSQVSSKSDDLFLKWFQHMDVEDGVAGESMGAGAEMMKGVDLSPNEEESDVEPSHEELESLQEQLSNSIAPGSSSRRKRVSMQEVDYSDPLRYLRLTATTSRLLTLTEEIKLSEGIQEINSDSDAETTEEQLLKQFMKKDLQEALDSLTSRERQVVRWRFGMDDGRTKTLQEIGEMMGVSRERIRQIESSAFKKLKNKKRTKHFQQYLVP